MLTSLLLSWEGGFLPGASCLALLELSPLFSPRNARALQRSTRQRTGPFPAPWLHCPGGGALLVLCWLVCGVALILDQHWVLPPEQLKPAGPCWAPPWDASQLLVPDASLGTPGAFRGSFPSLPLPSAGTRCPGMEMTSSTVQSPAPRYRTRQLRCRIVGCAGRGGGGWQLAGTWTGARAGVTTLARWGMEVAVPVALKPLVSLLSALLCALWAGWRSPRRTWHLARAASPSTTASSSSPTARARALRRTRLR